MPAPYISSATLSPSVVKVGNTITCTVTSGGSPTPTLSYQWYAIPTLGLIEFPISGATSSSWVATSGYEDHLIRCQVTASNVDGADIAYSDYALSDVLDQAVAPGKVTSLVAVLESGVIGMSWSAPTDTGVGGLQGYQWRIVCGDPGFERDSGWVSVSNNFASSLYTNYSTNRTYKIFVRARTLVYGSTYVPGLAEVYTILPTGGDTGDGDPVDKGGGISSVAAFSTKNFIYPQNELDIGYKTYSTKFNISKCPQTIAVGLFFNMPSTTNPLNTHFVEFVKYIDIDSNIKYGIIVYKKDNAGENSESNILGFTDVTAITKSIIKNLPKVMSRTSVNPPKYTKTTDEIFNLKVVHYSENKSEGNVSADGDEVIRVYLNNHEIKNWTFYSNNKQVSLKASVDGVLVSPIRPKKIAMSGTVNPNTIFGAYTSLWSKYALTTKLSDNTYNFSFTSSAQQRPVFLELYATQKALTDQDAQYFHTSTRYLTDIAMGKKPIERSYMMQSKPEVVGLNMYDVQYQTPAATTVDVLPVSYLLHYFPSDLPTEQKFMQKLFVNENALSYSVPLNTGFRAKMLIANNSNHVVFIKRESDSMTTAGVDLNLWTHNIIAPSDENIMEKVIDESNLSEAIQIDSQWIQSDRAAEKIINVIGGSAEGFAKEVTLNIFGNPLIQVGDIVNLSYSLNGIDNQKYLIVGVSHAFNEGLETSLTLRKLP